MAGKKDFSAANTGRVYSAITEATADPEQEPQQAQDVQRTRKEYNEQQAQEMRQAGTTQGRKGCKALRINMAFTPETHEYITTMARVKGESITDFVNHVLKQSMAANAELYEQAKAFKESFK
ncbi:MAG: hypothetical protein IKZ43_04525 [Acidaminococcaceae bacterium]|nr:hypothetical protein [Acidaminococcaceae bacterium]